MEQRPCLKCPVEVYGAEIAAEVLPHVYDDQQECARVHHCPEGRRCLLDGSWAEGADEESAAA